MVQARSPAPPPWRQVETLLNAWLEERQQLIVLLHRLQGTDKDSVDEDETKYGTTPIHHRIQALCQVLMDYISAGYFEVYSTLVREARQLTAEPPLWAERLIRRLDASTEEALLFNEDYDTSDHCLARLAELPGRVAQLMVTLEERFALEDQFILSIYQHPNAAAIRQR